MFEALTSNNIKMLKSNNIVVLIVIVTAVVIADAASSNQDAATPSLKFGFDLYTATLGENPRGNVIVSPLSVQTALGLVLMGANGTTAEQIVRGLNLRTGDRSSLASHFQEILDRYGGDDKLKIANKVYLKEGFQLNPQFSETAKKQFRSEAETVNFSESEAAANNINSWVEDKTNGKIRDLISADSLNADTRMVLINAVHFKAAWIDQFYKDSTEKKDFWISETESVQVDTMYGDIDVVVHQISALDAQMVLVPYKETNLVMAIFLPNSRTGLEALENKLRNFEFGSLSFDLTEKKNVKLLLPKFKIESNVDLKTVLTKMGMEDMFTRAADFPSLINSNERLKVDEAIHKTYISVDEEGTEASAATVSKVVHYIRPTRIEVNHPFLFAIMNADDVAFIGSVRSL